ncbi:hypothetical protein LUZ60_011930 [Juncus effusus]|nr:hypothetical protein LUZ60_011930 [Juncus effusus]
MDSNWTPSQGQSTADWRLQLRPEARRRILNNLMDTLKRHVPSPECLDKLQQLAARFEEKIYNESFSQAEYLRRISHKILSIDKNRHGLQIDPASNSNPNLQNQNCMDPGLGGTQSLAGMNQSVPAGAQSLTAGMNNNTVTQPVGPSHLVRPNHIYANQLRTNGMNGGMTAGMTNSMTASMNGGMTNDMNGGMTAGMTESMTHGMTGGMTASTNGGMTHGLNGGMTAGMTGSMTAGMNGGMTTSMNERMASGMTGGMTASMAGGMTASMTGGMTHGMTGGMTHGMAGEMQVQQNQLNLVQQRQQNYAVGINVTDLQEQHRQMKMQQNQMRENQILQNQMRENQILQNQMPRNQNINPHNMVNSQLIHGVASSSSAQTGAPTDLAVGEIFQKVKSMKEQYFMDLNEIYERLSLKLNQHIDMDLTTNTKVADRFEKMKYFMNFLEQLLNILQLDKLQCVESHFSLKDKLHLYEQQIISILQKYKIVPPPQQQQVPPQQQQMLPPQHQQQMPPPQQQLTSPPQQQSPSPAHHQQKMPPPQHQQQMPPPLKQQLPSPAQQQPPSPAQRQQQMPPPQQRPQNRTKAPQSPAQQKQKTPIQLIPANSPFVPSQCPPVTPSQVKPLPNLHNSSPCVQTGQTGLRQQRISASQQGGPGLKTGAPTSSPLVPSPSTSVEKPPAPAQQPQPGQTGRLKHEQSSSAGTPVPARQTDRLKHEQSGSAGTPVPTHHNNISTESTEKSSENEISPIERLTKALRAGSNSTGLHGLIKSAVTDIYSVIRTVDRIAGSGSLATVGSDLVPMGKRHLPDRNWDDQPPLKKLKWDVSARPLNDDDFCGKMRETEVNHGLMKEIKEINARLIDTELIISEEEESNANSTKGTVIKCVHTGVAIGPALESQLSPILPLRLLVPAGYPKPIILDKLPEEQRDSDDLSTKARSRFSRSLRDLSEPFSLKEIAHKWDLCARQVILDYAQQIGGGTFSSSFCIWQKII